MIITLIRKVGTKGFTEGKLYLDGVYFCDTIEDEERVKKIQDKTAIPKGKYSVIINMSNRFKKLMPLLLNVPNYTGVRIHSGNTSEDTEGCILVGKKLKDGFITKSRDTFKLLMKKLEGQKDITIEIKGE